MITLSFIGGSTNPSLEEKSVGATQLPGRSKQFHSSHFQEAQHRGWSAVYARELFKRFYGLKTYLSFICLQLYKMFITP